MGDLGTMGSNFAFDSNFRGFLALLNRDWSQSKGDTFGDTHMNLRGPRVLELSLFHQMKKQISFGPTKLQYVLEQF